MRHRVPSARQRKHPVAPAAARQRPSGRSFVRPSYRSGADDPTKTEAKAATLVEALGGYVSTSNVSRGSSSEGDGGSLYVTLHRACSCAEIFRSARGASAASARGCKRGQVSGQDVTEEYVDLEARLQHPKSARGAVPDHHAKQSAFRSSTYSPCKSNSPKLRGEIEKLVGRKKFLSTIKSAYRQSPSLSSAAPMPTPGASATHFRRAGRDAKRRDHRAGPRIGARGGCRIADRFVRSFAAVA